MIVIVLVLLSLFAFPTEVRKNIGRRDGWQCQKCGKRFADGWMVQASHFPHCHHKTHPDYYTEAGGEILCIACHIQQHLDGTSLGKRADKWAIDKLRSVDERTYEYRRAQGW